jgi:hypothetical protein
VCLAVTMAPLVLGRLSVLVTVAGLLKSLENWPLGAQPASRPTTTFAELEAVRELCRVLRLYVNFPSAADEAPLPNSQRS